MGGTRIGLNGDRHGRAGLTREHGEIQLKLKSFWKTVLKLTTVEVS